MSLGTPTQCLFVPPYVLDQIAGAPALGVEVDPECVECAKSTLVLDERLRGQRRDADPTASHAEPEAAPWRVHTAANGTQLPGRQVRAAGEPEAGDAAVEEAATGGSAALALFAEVYGRDSFDGAGAPVIMTVHYGRNYDNAFWNGTQLVFGDGDGRIFDRFTKPVDVLAHELAHAVTEHTAGLVYRNQPGALNESLSDVFASCTKQRLLGQGVAEADWLIGTGLFLPGVQARALRDMAAPGTAYDDPVLGRDPQSGHMDGYIETTDDNGGVHLNSGIPNRAFHLAALAIGRSSWEGAGAIWYAALTGPHVGPLTDFAGFAAATVAAAGSHGEAVTAAWSDVGVTPGPLGAPAEPPAPTTAREIQVSRSGGFAGRTTRGSVSLVGDDPRAPEVRQLLDRVDLRSAVGGLPHPDMFVFTFELPGVLSVDVPEHQLTPELRRLADLVLDGDNRS